uniref:Uncharacterized protein n=1 Tax=Anguilla anguilla TaxID=7936 RepID=A0A0E9WI65_ANGAN
MNVMERKQGLYYAAFTWHIHKLRLVVTQTLLHTPLTLEKPALRGFLNQVGEITRGMSLKL